MADVTVDDGGGGGGEGDEGGGGGEGDEGGGGGGMLQTLKLFFGNCFVEYLRS
jgi:hypothetical protein